MQTVYQNHQMSLSFESRVDLIVIKDFTSWQPERTKIEDGKVYSFSLSNCVLNCFFIKKLKNVPQKQSMKHWGL